MTGVTENELEIPDLSVLTNGDCLEVRMSGVIRLRIGSTRADNSWRCVPHLLRLCSCILTSSALLVLNRRLRGRLHCL